MAQRSRSCPTSSRPAFFEALSKSKRYFWPSVVEDLLGHLHTARLIDARRSGFPLHFARGLVEREEIPSAAFSRSIVPLSIRTSTLGQSSVTHDTGNCTRGAVPYCCWALPAPRHRGHRGNHHRQSSPLNHCDANSSQSASAAWPRARRRKYVRRCIWRGFWGNGSNRFGLPPSSILIFRDRLMLRSLGPSCWLA
jgi:hypothetical protein